jgi:very-short-patch-repair endonuclease
MLQLARDVPGIGELQRQVEVFDRDGVFIARVDLAEPEIGFFIELDGQHHTGQPVYDASRETAVVAATGWLCGRFTWYEVTRTPRTSARRLRGVGEQARARPFSDFRPR